MPIDFKLLIATIASAPIIVVTGQAAAQSLLVITIVLSFAASMVTVRNADVAFLSRATGCLGLLCAIPALWIILQLLPLPFAGLTNPMWTTAATAFQETLTSTITIAPEMTRSSLINYVSLLMLVATTTMLGKDRKNAQWLLLALMIISSVLVVELSILNFFERSRRLISANQVADLTGTAGAIGLLLSSAALLLAIERNAGDKRVSTPNIVLAGTCAAICLLGFVAHITVNSSIVLGFAFAVFAAVQLVRRAALGFWSVGIVAATLTITSAMLVIRRSIDLGAAPISIRFATQLSRADAATAERLVTDASWLGSGAGTYSALASIYQELGSNTTGASTTMATWLAELGLPMMAFVGLLGLSLAVIFVIGALNRGRDSMFATVSAACSFILLGQTFCDANFLNPGISVIGAATVGLGLAQSVGGRPSRGRASRNGQDRFAGLA